jgi:hypothetical protein
MPLNEFEANLANSNVWMHFVLISLSYHFSPHILTIGHMDTVKYIYNVFYHLLPAKLNYFLHTCPLHVRAPCRWLQETAATY